MAQAVRATVRAVKSTRKFVPRKAAIVLVRASRTTLCLLHNTPVYLQTQSAASKVKELLAENTEAVSSVVIQGV